MDTVHERVDQVDLMSLSTRWQRQMPGKIELFQGVLSTHHGATTTNVAMRTPVARQRHWSTKVLCDFKLIMTMYRRQPERWLIEQGLTSHQTHYRSYWGHVFTGQMTQPTVSKHWRNKPRKSISGIDVYSRPVTLLCFFFPPFPPFPLFPPGTGTSNPAKRETTFVVTRHIHTYIRIYIAPKSYKTNLRRVP